jgi:hypothetical protein
MAQSFFLNNRAIRGQKNREGELKLILSSNAKGWNFAEKVIAEKNLPMLPGNSDMRWQRAGHCV